MANGGRPRTTRYFFHRELSAALTPERGRYLASRTSGTTITSRLGAVRFRRRDIPPKKLKSLPRKPRPAKRSLPRTAVFPENRLLPCMALCLIFTIQYNTSCFVSSGASRSNRLLSLETRIIYSLRSARPYVTNDAAIATRRVEQSRPTLRNLKYSGLPVFLPALLTSYTHASHETATKMGLYSQ